MGNGQFWYNGIRNCLLKTFKEIKEPLVISLIFNVDGLPPFRSASTEFWPILFRIANMDHLKPMVVAIYCGQSKPPLQEFFTQYVNELNDIVLNGIICNEHKIEVNIMYFVCDTPARNFIIGTVGFNAAHGCIKCTEIGKYDKGGRHMSFPKIDRDLRTDESFRRKLDEDHHKEDSPLLALPIDMVGDFIVADSLHLFDLGVMRKCLYGWIYGNYNFRTKFSRAQIDSLSHLLEQCNQTRPVEIHRAIRNLKCLKFWKGLEYRTFLLYLGPVVLRDILGTEVYEHYLILFCAVTIISCKTYLKYISVAEQLLKDYIVKFIEIYGIDAISSNVHNLCHVINDIKKFGNLSEISAYPFENFLGHLKLLLRNGNRPLAQIAKRIIELSKLNSTTNQKHHISSPFVKNHNQNKVHQLPSCRRVFNSLHFNDNFILANNKKNRWFMTYDGDIVSMINATYYHDEIHVYGSCIKLKYDFFNTPVKSSFLNIYQSDGALAAPKLFSLKEIKCKLFSLEYKRNFIVFLPILHTLDHH